MKLRCGNSYLRRESERKEEYASYDLIHRTVESLCVKEEYKNILEVNSNNFDSI